MASQDLATVFLDRDGVINRRIPNQYIGHLKDFEILPGVIESIYRLNQAGYRTVVVTNQRGIAIGRTSCAQVDTLHQHLEKEVAQAGGKLQEFYICPHDRDQNCGCRKPAPGLLDQAASKQPVDWSNSYLVGDSDTDIQAGQARNVTTIKVAGPSQVGADATLPDLPAAVNLILQG